MPSILSKELKARLLGSEWSFGYNCYEVGHTWTPSCTDAALEVALAAGMKIMPLYAMLYSFSQVAVHQKYDLPSSWETSKSIIRSSFFIFFQAYNGAALGCALRRGFGRFYYRVLVIMPALLSSYLALVIEKPARRQALAFYMLNLASEIVYRMLMVKGYLRPIKHGETLLFALSLSAWYYLLKTHGFSHDPVSSVVKVLIGRDEAKSRAKTNKLPLAIASTSGDSTFFKLMKQAKHKLSSIIDKIGQEFCDGKHECCPHEESSCLRYIIGPMPSRFILGYTIQSLLKLSARPIDLLKAPRNAIVSSFTSPNSTRFGLFLVTLVSTGRLSSCLLRRYSNSNENWHGLVSGFLAGLSMLWAPRSSLSMYLMWKAVEQYYLKAAKSGKVQYVEFTFMSIYGLSAALILYAFALEPKFVRPSYMKFLDEVSDHRLHQLNRLVLDVFGTGSSVGYEDFFPDLDPKYMSNQFKELIFNWMIQPYE